MVIILNLTYRKYNFFSENVVGVSSIVFIFSTKNNSKNNIILPQRYLTFFSLLVFSKNEKWKKKKIRKTSCLDNWLASLEIDVFGFWEHILCNRLFFQTCYYFFYFYFFVVITRRSNKRYLALKMLIWKCVWCGMAF